ncbi:MAG: hypothetical protein C5B49_00175 [Bdellovibrio sp.]|nr:MAG: hypothetical protein C5B49_00175 [Bdellovibrio sp.]
MHLQRIAPVVTGVLHLGVLISTAIFEAKAAPSRSGVILANCAAVHGETLLSTMAVPSTEMPTRKPPTSELATSELTVSPKFEDAIRATIASIKEVHSGQQGAVALNGSLFSESEPSLRPLFYLISEIERQVQPGPPTWETAAASEAPTLELRKSKPPRDFDQLKRELSKRLTQLAFQDIFRRCIEPGLKDLGIALKSPEGITSAAELRSTLDTKIGFYYKGEQEQDQDQEQEHDRKAKAMALIDAKIKSALAGEPGDYEKTQNNRRGGDLAAAHLLPPIGRVVKVPLQVNDRSLTLEISASYSYALADGGEFKFSIYPQNEVQIAIRQTTDEESNSKSIFDSFRYWPGS